MKDHVTLHLDSQAQWNPVGKLLRAGRLHHDSGEKTAGIKDG